MVQLFCLDILLNVRTTQNWFLSCANSIHNGFFEEFLSKSIRYGLSFISQSPNKQRVKKLKILFRPAGIEPAT